ncbi:MAG: hypothetical protein WCP92_08420 [bacterium]
MNTIGVWLFRHVFIPLHCRVNDSVPVAIPMFFPALFAKYHVVVNDKLSSLYPGCDHVYSLMLSYSQNINPDSACIFVVELFTAKFGVNVEVYGDQLSG